MYQVNEGGAPEMLTVGAKQYLMPNARGEVVSNSDAASGSIGWTIINNNYASDVVSSSVSVDESSKTITMAVKKWPANCQREQARYLRRCRAGTM